MRKLVLAGLVTVAVSGCVSRSEGQLGHASFSYESCLFGCSTADNSLAAGGAHATVSVALQAGYTFAAVHSTNPAVVSASFGSGVGTSVDVVSGTPGTAMLQLFDGFGKLVDQTPLTVEATAKLGVKQGWTGAMPIVLAGSAQVFHVTTLDANGRATIGTGSVAFDVKGPLAVVSQLFTDGDSVAFSGTPGVGSVTATAAGGATASLMVDVIPASAVTSIDATVKPNTVENATVYANVVIVAHSASGLVYGATCNWQNLGASVSPDSQLTASLESPAQTTARLILAQPGTFSATCVIGNASTTVKLTR